MSLIGSLEARFSESFEKKLSEKATETTVKKVESGVVGASKKATEKITEETVQLSRAALSQGKLSSLVNMPFVEEMVVKEVSTKTGDLTSKDAVKMIEQANKKYVEKTPDLVALKYRSMSESPFAFDRATDYLFVSNAQNAKQLQTKVKIPIAQDIHLENFGTYKTSEGKVAFGINDFDETVVAPYTWDLARVGSSIRLAAKQNGLSEKEGKDLVEVFVRDYVDGLKKFQEKTDKIAEPLTKSNSLGDSVEKTIKLSESASQKDFIKELTKDGKFVFNDKIRPISSEVRKEVEAGIKAYAKGRPEGADFFKIKDSAFMIAGKGSLGRERYVVLLEGAGKGKKEQVILELKEAVQPNSISALGKQTGNQAQRVVDAAKNFQPATDPFLGVTKINGKDFFVREVSPSNNKVELEKLNTFSELKDYIESIALIVSKAHATSGKTSEIIADVGSKKELAEKIGDFSQNYLEKVQAYFNEFKKTTK